jgi:hypothetical protein
MFCRFEIVLLERFACPEGQHGFHEWIPVKSRFQALDTGLMGTVEGGLMGPHSNEWSVRACPDFK